MKHKYTEQQLRDAIGASTSIRQALLILGVEAKGGNYNVIRKAATLWGIDTSHFTGQGWRSGKTFQPKRSVDQYLDNSYPINSFRLKNRLIEEGILQPICSSCNLTRWLTNLIPLELDHIDGDPVNNELTNLRLLCPNCHALTSTYRGKNKKMRNSA